jgi:hypothetical protein
VLTDNVTKTVGAHILKAGITAEKVYTTVRTDISSVFSGEFDFGRNVNNPLDTGYAYSNAAMGVFATYRETNTRRAPGGQNTYVEWFLQDTWKVNRRLTLDLGLRFYYIGQRVGDDMVTAFVESRFDRSRAVQLIRPALSGTARAGVHPVTGQIFPAAAIGAIAPGTGDLANGLVVPAWHHYPVALMENPGIQ